MKKKFHKKYFNIKKFEKKSIMDFNIIFSDKGKTFFNNETELHLNNKKASEETIFNKDDFPFCYDDLDNMEIKYIKKEDVDFKTNVLTANRFIPQFEIEFMDGTKYVDYFDLEYVLSWLSKPKKKQKLMKKSKNYKYLKQTPFGKQWKTHYFDDLFFTCDCGVPECNGYFEQSLKQKDNRIILKYYINRKYIKLEFDRKIFIEKVKKAYVDFLTLNNKLISVLQDLDKKDVLSLDLINPEDIHNIDNDKKILTSLKNISLKEYFKDENNNLFLNIEYSENYYHYFFDYPISSKDNQSNRDCNSYIQFTIINEMKNVIFLKNLFKKVISKFK